MCSCEIGRTVLKSQASLTNLFQAPNIDVLIFGRAFAGVGAAGIFVAVLSIIAEVTRLEQRPKLLGLFGAVFAVRRLFESESALLLANIFSWLYLGRLTLAQLVLHDLRCLASLVLY